MILFENEVGFEEGVIFALDSEAETEGDGIGVSVLTGVATGILTGELTETGELPSMVDTMSLFLFEQEDKIAVAIRMIKSGEIYVFFIEYDVKVPL